MGTQKRKKKEHDDISAGEDLCPPPRAKKANAVMTSTASPAAESDVGSSEYYQQIGAVTHLFVKTGAGKVMAERSFLEFLTQDGIVGNSGTSQAQLVDDPQMDHSKSSFLGTLVSKAVGELASAGGERPSVAGGSTPICRSPWALSPRQVLLSSTQNLADLSLSPGELRENLVVRLDPGVCAQLQDALHSGCVVQIGDDARGPLAEADMSVLLRLTFGCEPCGHVLDRMKRFCPQKASYPTVKAMEGKRGLLATVLRGGRIAKNDALRVLVAGPSSSSSPPATRWLPPLIKYECLSDKPRDRFLKILAKVPGDRVVTIKQLLIYSGAPPGYARALPAILKAALSERSGATQAIREGCARLVYASRELFREDVVPLQRATLERCGVAVRRCAELGVKADKSGWCVEEKFVWRPVHAELFLDVV